jgi:hypothetical protein
MLCKKCNDRPAIEGKNLCGFCEIGKNSIVTVNKSVIDPISNDKKVEKPMPKLKENNSFDRFDDKEMLNNNNSYNFDRIKNYDTFKIREKELQRKTEELEKEIQQNNSFDIDLLTIIGLVLGVIFMLYLIIINGIYLLYASLFSDVSYHFILMMDMGHPHGFFLQIMAIMFIMFFVFNIARSGD